MQKVCRKCGSDVRFQETGTRGLGFKIAVCCATCNPQYINSSPVLNSHAFDINRRIIFALRLLGIGYNGLAKFCAFMCLPNPIVKTAYYKVIDAMHTASTAVREIITKKAAQREKELSEEDNDLSGLTVSGDGSWKKRGFSSLLGVSTLIGWRTGQIVDLDVKCKVCKACDQWKQKEGTAEFEEWYEDHKSSCHRNYEGASGNMEVDSIIEMFRRSVGLHNVKYSHYIGDGDTKTFKGILDSQPYEDLVVRKKECVDHVQKRMGSRLRQLVKKTKGLSGKGKLTGKLIDELTIYYGLAIRKNSASTADMKREVMATLHHKMSTDEEPQHDGCPEGADSWSTWQKAKFNDELNNYKHKPAMKKEIYTAILPVYQDLSRDELLERCLGGYTQNANESFNATIWALAPKTIHSGKEVVEIASNLAACNFNEGLNGILKVMRVLQLDIGETCHSFCAKADSERVNRAEARLSEGAKMARRSILGARKQQQLEEQAAEGIFYGPGIAD